MHIQTTHVARPHAYADTIPLADQSQQGISDSQSTLNSEEGTPVATVPSVEVRKW